MQKQRSLQEDPQQIINNVIEMKKSMSEMEINEETNLYMDPVLGLNDDNSKESQQVLILAKTSQVLDQMKQEGKDPQEFIAMLRKFAEEKIDDKERVN